MSLFDQIKEGQESARTVYFDYERKLAPEIVSAAPVVSPNPIRNIQPKVITQQQITLAEKTAANSPVDKKVTGDRVTRHDLFLASHPSGTLSSPTGQLGKVALPSSSFGVVVPMVETASQRTLKDTKAKVTAPAVISTQGTVSLVDRFFNWINRIFPVR